MIADALLHVLSRRSIENPAVSLTDPAAWEQLFGDTFRSTSGEAVTYKSALTVSGLMRGVRLIASTVGKLPLAVHQRNEAGGSSPAREHAAYNVLRNAPSPFMPAFQFRQALTANAILRGNGYAYIGRRGDGSVESLTWLDPELVTPTTVNGVPYYSYRTPNGGMQVFDQTSILHIRGLGYDGLTGYSIVEYAANSLGLSLGAHKYQSKFFANSAAPQAVVKVPGDMKPEAQREFLRQWEAMHKGANNSHRIAIITQGGELVPFSLSAKDSQLIETRKFELVEIANWLGLPPHKLGDGTRTAYASLEQENQSYLDDAIDPWLVTWEQECREKLLSEDEKQADSHFVEFNRRALVRADTKTEIDAINTEVNGGLLLADEGRALLNLPPLPGDTGKKLRIPGNLLIMDEEGEVTTINGTQPAAQDAQPQDTQPEDAPPEPAHQQASMSPALRAVCRQAAARAVNRLGHDARRAAGKPAGFLGWLDSLSELRGVLTEIVGPAWSLASGSDNAAAGKVETLIESWRSALLTVSGEATAADLASRVEAFCVLREQTEPDRLVNEMEVPE